MTDLLLNLQPADAAVTDDDRAFLFPAAGFSAADGPAADQAAASNPPTWARVGALRDYQGTWAMSGVEGKIYTHSGSAWLALTDTTATPSDTATDWAKLSGHSGVYRGDYAGGTAYGQGDVVRDGGAFWRAAADIASAPASFNTSQWRIDALPSWVYLDGQAQHIGLGIDRPHTLLHLYDTAGGEMLRLQGGSLTGTGISFYKDEEGGAAAELGSIDMDALGNLDIASAGTAGTIDLVIGNRRAWSVLHTGHIIPGFHEQHDLGEASAYVRRIYAREMPAARLFGSSGDRDNALPSPLTGQLVVTGGQLQYRSATAWENAGGSGGGGATTLAALSDTPDDYGSSGQVLQSTGTGTEWATPASGGSGQAAVVTELWDSTDHTNKDVTSAFRRGSLPTGTTWASLRGSLIYVVVRDTQGQTGPFFTASFLANTFADFGLNSGLTAEQYQGNDPAIFTGDTLFRSAIIANMLELKLPYNIAAGADFGHGDLRILRSDNDSTFYYASSHARDSYDQIFIYALTPGSGATGAAGADGRGLSDWIYIDDTNRRLGIDQASPATALDIQGESSNILRLRRTGSGDTAMAQFAESDGSALLELGTDPGGGRLKNLQSGAGETNFAFETRGSLQFKTGSSFSSRLELDSDGHLKPASDYQYDLGFPATGAGEAPLRFRSIYAANHYTRRLLGMPGVAGADAPTPSLTLGGSASDTIHFTGLITSDFLPAGVGLHDLGGEHSVWHDAYMHAIRATYISPRVPIPDTGLPSQNADQYGLYIRQATEVSGHLKSAPVFSTTAARDDEISAPLAGELAYTNGLLQVYGGSDWHNIGGVHAGSAIDFTAIGSDVVASHTNTYSIGTSQKRWGNIYANHLYGPMEYHGSHDYRDATLVNFRSTNIWGAGTRLTQSQDSSGNTIGTIRILLRDDDDLTSNIDRASLSPAYIAKALFHSSGVSTGRVPTAGQDTIEWEAVMSDLQASSDANGNITLTPRLSDHTTGAVRTIAPALVAKALAFYQHSGSRQNAEIFTRNADDAHVWAGIAETLSRDLNGVTLQQNLRMAERGSENNVAFAHSGDGNTGLYFPDDNAIGFSSQGHKKWEINETGALLRGPAQVAGDEASIGADADGERIDNIYAETLSYTSLVQNSARSGKFGIRDITDSEWEGLLDLRLREFRRRHSPDRREIGIVAEETADTWIKQSRTGGQVVNTGHLLWALIRSNQLLHHRLNQLEPSGGWAAEPARPADTPADQGVPPEGYNQDGRIP